jgi:hypothetical protein
MRIINMLFLRDEKVFSVSKTMGAVPYDDIKTLFSEFFCYLLITGLYLEGRSHGGLRSSADRLSENQGVVGLFDNCYNYKLGKIYSDELIARYKVLLVHPDIIDSELKVLRQLDGIFLDKNETYGYQLSANDILGIAYRRVFTNDMMNIAHYVAVTFGQTEFPETKKLPVLYISLFGNIHLSQYDTTMVSAPKLLYGTLRDGVQVTALWSLLSTQIDSIGEAYWPGNYLGDLLTSLSFLGADVNDGRAISYPRLANALSVSGRLGIDGFNPIPMSAQAYKEFLYGTIRGNSGKMDVINTPIFLYILNVMMEKVEATSQTHLFAENSSFRKLYQFNQINYKKVDQPHILQYALEALDAKVDDTEQSSEESADGFNEEDDTTKPTEGSTEDPIEEDPQTDENGYDPASPPPAVPIGAPSMDKNTINIISFDKTGEGVNEDLYRTAVIALNDRLQRDDSIEIESETKDALNYWVNGFLYRTAISATKDQISSLGLQQHLKILSKVKG